MESQKARRLAQILKALCCERQLTVAVAESLTGGLLGAYISSVPGSSEYFLGGIISYSVTMKQEILKVSKDTIDTHGVVSAQCAEEMASGARRLCDADIGIALTGYAGPSIHASENAGDVWASVVDAGGAFTSLSCFGDIGRQEVRLKAVEQALELLIDCARQA